MNHLQDAIQVFEDRKTNYDKWYMSRPAVSLVMLLERTELFRQCDFAIEELKRAQSAEQVEHENEKQKTIDQRREACFRDCKDLCQQNVASDGTCRIAERETAKELMPLFFPE